MTSSLSNLGITAGFSYGGGATDSGDHGGGCHGDDGDGGIDYAQRPFVLFTILCIDAG